MRREGVEIVRVAGEPMNADQRRLLGPAEIEIMQSDSPGGLKLVFGHLGLSSLRPRRGGAHPVVTVRDWDERKTFEQSPRDFKSPREDAGLLAREF